MTGPPMYSRQTKPMGLLGVSAERTVSSVRTGNLPKASSLMGLPYHARCISRPVTPPVHLVKYASQPDLQFACDGTWDTPSWKAFRQGYVSPHPPGVYEADGGRLYTFDEK